MAGFNGRALIVSNAATTLVGIRTRGFSVANAYVDVTTDDDTGWRTLLAAPGLRSVEATVAGITSDEDLLGLIMAASVSAAAISVELPTSLLVNGTMAGSFLISAFAETGAHDGAVEFTATLMSTGTVTYTASSAV